MISHDLWDHLRPYNDLKNHHRGVTRQKTWFSPKMCFWGLPEYVLPSSTVSGCILLLFGLKIWKTAKIPPNSHKFADLDPKLVSWVPQVVNGTSSGHIHPYWAPYDPYLGLLWPKMGQNSQNRPITTGSAWKIIKPGFLKIKAKKNYPPPPPIFRPIGSIEGS